jgi:hypothetical protein
MFVLESNVFFFSNVFFNGVPHFFACALLAVTDELAKAFALANAETAPMVFLQIEIVDEKFVLVHHSPSQPSFHNGEQDVVFLSQGLITNPISFHLQHSAVVDARACSKHTSLLLHPASLQQRHQMDPRHVHH